MEKRVSIQRILEILHNVKDPGVPMTLEEMGIISRDWIHVDGDGIRVDFRPTSPYCPVSLALGVVIKHTLEKNLNIDVEVAMLRGSHLQENMVNDLLGDRERFAKALERLRSSGFVDRCCY